MPEEYAVRLTPAAQAGLDALDRSEQILVVKQMDKLKRAPELGPPLGNKMGLNLAGYRKLYAAQKRIRIIYEIRNKSLVVLVVAVGPRDKARVYEIAEAEARRRRLRRIS